MSSPFLSLPLELHAIPSKGTLQRCSARQSIAHHLHLILTTSLGELSSNDAFGCGLWDADFDNLTSRSKLRDGLVTSLTDAIRAHEPRLANIRAELQMHQEELNSNESSKRIKNRLNITISAVIAGTNEPIVYRDHFFISPLSYN